MMWLRALVAVCCVVVSGCGGDAASFTNPDESFEVDPGDEFVVVLESNATTGFSWQLEVEPPSTVVRLVRDLYVEPDTALVGAGGRQEMTFEAIGDGSTFIQLWYVRSFDDPPEPSDRAQFEVIVGTGDSGDAVDPDDVDEPGSTFPDEEDAISVVEFLAAAPQDPVPVRGLLFDDGSGLRLCDTLAESFPPQCPGDFVVIANPGDVVVDFNVEQGVRWADEPVVVLGRYGQGELIVMR
ncbi:MAG: protease inhibitor I42 family protein [Acidimicrobiia bacterium]|nr:protease inhibitor I42 family protein [Acidimicrobiia bacterium]